MSDNCPFGSYPKWRGADFVISLTTDPNMPEGFEPGITVSIYGVITFDTSFVYNLRLIPGYGGLRTRQDEAFGCVYDIFFAPRQGFDVDELYKALDRELEDFTA